MIKYFLDNDFIEKDNDESISVFSKNKKPENKKEIDQYYLQIEDENMKLKKIIELTNALKNQLQLAI